VARNTSTSHAPPARNRHLQAAIWRRQQVARVAGGARVRTALCRQPQAASHAREAERRVAARRHVAVRAAPKQPLHLAKGLLPSTRCPAGCQQLRQEPQLLLRLCQLAQRKLRLHQAQRCLQVQLVQPRGGLKACGRRRRLAQQQLLRCSLHHLHTQARQQLEA
jgi:hypothetical protein